MTTSDPMLPTAVLGARFSEAVRWAAMLHADDVRKGTRIAYVSHLLAVASLVLEDGGSEEEAIAAMLHDTIEDRATPEAEIRARFGQPIADIVVACSEPPGIDRNAATWRERKQHYLHHLAAGVSESARRVAAADKLHNARSILSDLRDHGPAVWEKFNAPVEDQRWYYTELARVLTTAHDGPTVRELQRVVDALVAEIDAA
ncbi:MAG: HD domain-containing protein [Acidimicrobiia bacterium]